jgi:hypothetical protein
MTLSEKIMICQSIVSKISVSKTDKVFDIYHKIQNDLFGISNDFEVELDSNLRISIKQPPFTIYSSVLTPQVGCKFYKRDSNGSFYCEIVEATEFQWTVKLIEVVVTFYKIGQVLQVKSGTLLFCEE